MVRGCAGRQVRPRTPSLSNQLLERPQRDRAGPQFSFAPDSRRSFAVGVSRRRSRRGEKMELLNNLALGFSVALHWNNILYCLFGCLLGTLMGVLPGIGPIATIAMLLPATFVLPPVSALIMLAGIYYGAQYGGSTTAILVNLPGEVSSVVTLLDGSH